MSHRPCGRSLCWAAQASVQAWRGPATGSGTHRRLPRGHFATREVQHECRSFVGRRRAAVRHRAVRPTGGVPRPGNSGGAFAVWRGVRSPALTEPVAASTPGPVVAGLFADPWCLQRLPGDLLRLLLSGHVVGMGASALVGDEVGIQEGASRRVSTGTSPGARPGVFALGALYQGFSPLILRAKP